MALLLRGFTPVTSPPRPLNTGSFRLRDVTAGVTEWEDRSLSSSPSSIRRVRLVRCCAAKAFAFTSNESLILSVVFIMGMIQISVFHFNAAAPKRRLSGTECNCVSLNDTIIFAPTLIACCNFYFLRMRKLAWRLIANLMESMCAKSWQLD